MTGFKKARLNVLVIDDEPDIRDILIDCLALADCETQTAENPDQALEKLKAGKIDVVLSDIHMPGKSGLQFLSECREILDPVPAWVFISADGSPETVLKASRLGAIDVIQKPFNLSQIRNLLQRIQERKEDTIHEIMDLVQNISGIKLGREKRLLVETRLMRRARILGLESVSHYKDYFQANREKEVDELISAITTHTTSFFREPDHFDFLFDQVFPLLVSSQHPIRIWSAASSTGEEAYSLAISLLEYLEEKKIPRDRVPEIEIFGTDIDFHSVETAQRGIYEVEKIEKLQAGLIKKYFEIGTGELSGFVKVRDEVHRLCRFEQMNLLTKNYPSQQFEVVFIRNVLIYFQKDQIQEIGQRLVKCLSPDGFLFLGHSESFNGLKLPYRLAGNAIYRHDKAAPLSASVLKEGTPLIRTLIVDDSMTVRKVLSRVLTREHGFEVVGEAPNPLEAERILASTEIDLMTLDIHMPVMDGVSFLKKMQGRRLPPVVMISSISYEDAVTSLQCFELGAVDYIEKPNGLDLESESEKIRLVLRGASKVRRLPRHRHMSQQGASSPIEYRPRSSDLILIGASTGGTEAIRTVLTQLPENSPPALIVQHMPAHFSNAFAQRLNEVCQIRVQEAQDRMIVRPGNAYLAPGGYQMKAIRSISGELELQVQLDDPVNRHRPSVDYLFDSVVPLLKEKTVSAALLTGMGADGARGLKKLRDAGAHTIAQNEETCVVFGMPKEAIAMGAAIEVLPLPSISYHLIKHFRNRRAA